VNEFDDLEQLERECGPALRTALRRVATGISVDTSTWQPEQTVRFRNGEHAALDEREAHTTSANDVPRERYPRRRWLLVAAATIVVFALGLLAVAAVHDSDRVQTDTVPPTPAPSTNPATTSPVPPVESSPATLPATTVASVPTVASVAPETTTSAPVLNGWVAVDNYQIGGDGGGGDIYLVRPGQDARRIEVAGSDVADEACPAWSPDGTRLMFGRLTASSDTGFSNAELVIVPVGMDGVAGAPTVIALDGFQVLDGFEPHPCGAWAPDGRWVAVAGGNEVWVADTQTDAIRLLPDLRPSDLEWRPGTDELAIAGDMGRSRAADGESTPVSVYSVSTGELRQLGSVDAAHLTWSPDGSTLAYTGGESDANELWLVDADGANERLLVANLGEAVHGIGPVWSPTGDRIAYQRLACDSFGGCGERHEVVLVSVADGTETVIEPPATNGPNGQVRWYPYSVTWSPDGTTLLYMAWRVNDPELPEGVVAVSADTPRQIRFRLMACVTASRRLCVRSFLLMWCR
jgi:WD40 repeat protein